MATTPEVAEPPQPVAARAVAVLRSAAKPLAPYAGVILGWALSTAAIAIGIILAR